MTTTIYAQVGQDDVISRVWEMDWENPAHAARMGTPRAGTRYEILASWFDIHTAPTATSLPKFGEGVPYWLETDITAAVAAAIAKTYVDVDTIYDLAVGRRTTEYSNAEAAAVAYKAAGFTGPVSDYISGHAASNPTGQVQTNAWAAQQIIERADAFRWAELQMRNVRFARQAAMRAAASDEELAVAVGAWDGFIEFVRSNLGL